MQLRRMVITARTRRVHRPVALLACAALIAGAAHCGSTATPPGSARWPDRPDASISPSLAVDTFAIDSISFGDDEGWNGWKTHGFDLDGKVTTKDSTDVCRLAPGAPRGVQVDGARGGGVGIDNSFGANVAPLFGVGDGSLSAGLTGWMREGRFTLQVQTHGLTGVPSQTNVGLLGETFPSGPFDPDGGAAPSFGPGEDWPVRTDGLVDASALPFGARDVFPQAYTVGGTFVSRVGELTFGLTYDDAPIDVRVHDAIVVMTVDGDHAQGTLAGVVDVEQLVSGVRAVAGVVSASLCGSTFDAIAEQIAQQADILLDGTNHAGVPCDGISLGASFTARRVAAPVRTEPPPDPPDACAPPPDAGVVDAAADADWNLGCQSPADCADAGTDGGPEAGPATCCGRIEVTPQCAIGKTSASCEPEAACPTDIQLACGTTATVHPCATSADCDEPAYPRCCGVNLGSGTTPYLCVSSILSFNATCR